jgi:hypothetical protein
MHQVGPAAAAAATTTTTTSSNSSSSTAAAVANEPEVSANMRDLQNVSALFFPSKGEKNVSSP